MRESVISFSKLFRFVLFWVIKKYLISFYKYFDIAFTIVQINAIMK